MSGGLDGGAEVGGPGRVHAGHRVGVDAALAGAASDSHPPAPSGGGAELATAASTDLPSMVDVLRRTFPQWLNGKSPEYVDAFADVLLTVDVAGIAVVSTPFDRAVLGALWTARGLAGLYVSATRGQA
jgi:hypothetical protein